MGASDDEEAIVRCGTTKGEITLQLIREWSPNGFDRAVELFERHFFDESHFYRAVPKFLVQFGISYSKDKELHSFAMNRIQDDPKHDPPIDFHPGIISFAGSGPNSRTSQLFISYGSAGSLGKELWETPIGKVIDGMSSAEQFYSYGDMPPWGKGPVQSKIYNGPQYIEEGFPLIDKFLDCTVERSSTRNGGAAANAERDSDGDDDDGDDKNANADLGDFEENDHTEEAATAVPHDDDPMAGTDSPGNHKDNIKVDNLKGAQPKRRVRSAGQEKQFYAVPQDTHEKLIRSTNGVGNTDSNSFLFPVVVILAFLALIVLSVLFRGRRKDSSKRN